MITDSELRYLKECLDTADIYRGPVTVCEGIYETVDEAAELVKAKLAHYPDRPLLYGVDAQLSPDDGMTICITGNGPKALKHAEWIAKLLTYGPGLIERCLAGDTPPENASS